MATRQTIKRAAKVVPAGFTGDYDAARKAGGIVIVMCCTAGCPYCKDVKATALKSNAWRNFIAEDSKTALYLEPTDAQFNSNIGMASRFPVFSVAVSNGTQLYRKCKPFTWRGDNAADLVNKLRAEAVP
jgi:hypothetical protein